MLDYTKELTLHIQGLGMSFHHAFMEMEEKTQVGIPPELDIHSISIQKVGGYIPQLIRIVYLDKDYQEKQQAYMAKYSLGNLVCTPVEEEPTEHPFSHEMTLSNSSIGIILHINIKYLNKEWSQRENNSQRSWCFNNPNRWISLYQDSTLWCIKPYALETHPSISYLHT